MAKPSIDRVALPGDLVLQEPGDRGICAVYNTFIEAARQERDCEALVLLHDDVELLDRNFRAKAIAASGDVGVGVIGVIGGARLRDGVWWHARSTDGQVFESRGFINMGKRRSDVDVVDGLIMILTPAAISSLRFDEASFPSFHGYDVDFCLQARDLGMRVVVAPLDVVHRTKGGYGDQAAFTAAAKLLTQKWPQFIKPDPSYKKQLARVSGPAQKAARRYWNLRTNEQLSTSQTMRELSSAAKRRLGNNHQLGSAGTTGQLADRAQLVVEPGVTPTHEQSACPICGTQMSPPSAPDLPTIMRCSGCGLGVTWPPPGRDVAGEGIWEEQYGGLRLRKRSIWHREARLRVEWLQLFAPEGTLLEVGCGTGEFLNAAAEAGYDTYGAEVSRWAANHAREFDVDVVAGYLSDWRRIYPGLRPDLVAMWHVLEHAPDPGSLLREAAEILGPGGRVVLEVPNFASSEAERLGVEWEPAQPLDHYHHFTPEALTLLFEQCGYQVEQLLPMSRRVYTPLAAWKSEQNAALIERRPWPALDLLRASAVVCG